MSGLIRSLLAKYVKYDGNIEQRFTSGAIVGFAFQAIGLGLSLLLNVILARKLGASGYGIYAFVIAISAFGATLGRFGFDRTALRLLPEYRFKKNSSFAHGFMATSRGVVIAASVFVGFAISIGLWVFRRESAYNQGGILLLTAALVPVTALLALGQASLRGFGDLSRALSVDYLIRPTGVIITVVVFASIWPKYVTPRNALLITLIVMVVGVLLQQGWIRVDLRKFYEVSSKRATEWRRWIGLSTSFLGASVVTVILSKADVIMLGIIRGGKDVGYYNAAARIATLIGFGLTVLNIVAAPLISELHSENRSEELKRLLTLMVRASGLFGIALCGLVLLVSPWLLSEFGSGFQVAKASLWTLIIGQIVNIAAGPVGMMLAMTDRQNAMLKILLFGAALNLTIGVAGILHFGLIGAAIGTTSAMIFWNIAMIVYLYLRAKLLIVPFIGVFS